jgi:pimeloyl-ACP methyl ester carboxylesterase
MRTQRIPLLVLHGVNGTQAELQPWVAALQGDFDVHAIDLLGHAGRPLPEAFSLPAFADDVIAQMDALGLPSAVLLGYSFGGLLGLHLALHHPERVRGLVTVATKWHFTADAVRHIVYLFGTERLVALKERAAQLAAWHQPNDWKLLATRLAAMYSGFALAPPVLLDDLERLRLPALVLSGDADPIVAPEETQLLHEALQGSGLATYPGSAHPPFRVPTAGLREAVSGWARQVGLVQA